MNLILFGFKGSGKTTIGKLLALRLSRPFFDTDEMVERFYHQQTGEQLRVREIFKIIGEKSFRNLEADVAERLNSVKNSVIALGGGMILNPGASAALAKLGQLVYLKGSKETLKKRILSQELPPFFDPADPNAAFEKYYNERKARYEAIPALSVDLEAKTQDQVILELSALVLSQESGNG